MWQQYTNISRILSVIAWDNYRHYGSWDITFTNRYRTSSLPIQILNIHGCAWRGYTSILSEFIWVIHPPLFFRGLHCHWVYHMISSSTSLVVLMGMGKRGRYLNTTKYNTSQTTCIFLGMYCAHGTETSRRTQTAPIPWPSTAHGLYREVPISHHVVGWWWVIWFSKRIICWNSICWYILSILE